MLLSRVALPALVFSLAASLVACGDLGVVDGANGDVGPDAGPAGRTTRALQALYRFDQGSGILIQDQSGLGAPLDLVIEDTTSVRWAPGGGLELIAPTLIASASPAGKINFACSSNDAVTLEVWARAAEVNQAGPARVLTISGGNNARNATIAQSNQLADLRVRTTDTDDNGTPEIYSGIGAFGPATVHIVYTRSGLKDEAKVWINGELGSTETVGGTQDNWDLRYKLGIGADLDGEGPWLGTIYLAAVYCQELTAVEIANNYNAGY